MRHAMSLISLSLVLTGCQLPGQDKDKNADANGNGYAYGTDKDKEKDDKATTSDVTIAAITESPAEAEPVSSYDPNEVYCSLPADQCNGKPLSIFRKWRMREPSQAGGFYFHLEGKADADLNSDFETNLTTLTVPAAEFDNMDVHVSIQGDQESGVITFSNQRYNGYGIPGGSFLGTWPNLMQKTYYYWRSAGEYNRAFIMCPNLTTARDPWISCILLNDL